MIKKLTYLLFCLLPVLVSGQEYLTGLGGNPVIKSYIKEHPEVLDSKNELYKYPPLSLPFFDNFSNITIYPDTSRWVNNEAYINANFPFYPPDYGVATLDAIDANGNVYEEANNLTFLADRLISRPIRLDSAYVADEDITRALNPADSVYFSFYYQPQGRGDVPLKHDSLVLQFGRYNGSSVFAHFSYIMVYGYDYPDIVENGPAQPLDVIYPPEGFGCDAELGYILEEEFSVEDSLLIPCDSVFVLETDWTSVWSAEGDTLEDFINENGSYFKYEVLPIVDTAWFHNDFQFRFINYASISEIPSWKSNTDHWHIDRVKLDVKRTYKDLYEREVSFVQNARTFLKAYSSMPYKQYSSNPTSFTRDSTSAYIHNLDSVPHDVVYNYYVQREDGDTLAGFAIDNYTHSAIPYKEININDYQPFVNRPIDYVFVISNQNLNYNFRISHVARDANNLEIGDTLIFNQLFSNYISLDDGTAERGYGLSPAGSKLAIKYNTSFVDTLWGVQMFFNKTYNNANNKAFDITVWQDNNGIPGNISYQEQNVKPFFTDGLNQFHTYWFTEPLKLGVETFYVGWEQSTGDVLNIGFDKNVNSKNRTFFNTGGTWVNSNFEGSVMIRPLLGKHPWVNVPENKKAEMQVHVFPNPVVAGNEIHIQFGENNGQNLDAHNLTLELIDIYGKLVFKGPYADRMSTIGLRDGFYILRIVDNTSAKYFTAKLLIR